MFLKNSNGGLLMKIFENIIITKFGLPHIAKKALWKSFQISTHLFVDLDPKEQLSFGMGEEIGKGMFVDASTRVAVVRPVRRA